MAGTRESLSLNPEPLPLTITSPLEIEMSKPLTQDSFQTAPFVYVGVVSGHHVSFTVTFFFFFFCIVYAMRYLGT